MFSAEGLHGCFDAAVVCSFACLWLSVIAVCVLYFPSFAYNCFMFVSSRFGVCLVSAVFFMPVFVCLLCSHVFVCHLFALFALFISCGVFLQDNYDVFFFACVCVCICSKVCVTASGLFSSSTT